MLLTGSAVAQGVDEKQLDTNVDGIPHHLQHRVTRTSDIPVGRQLQRFDMLVLSPGIPFARHPLVEQALALGVPVTSELAFAAAMLPTSVRIVAITGTNGKSTTTHFVSQMLESMGVRVWSGGNLGNPLSSLAYETASADCQPPNVAVVEVSSYQLEAPGPIPVEAACVLNITPDHLDRHETVEKYAHTKARIVRMIQSGPTGALISEDLIACCGNSHLLQSCPRIGSLPGIAIDGKIADIQHFNWRAKRSLDLSQLKVPGEHNKVNAAAAAFLACSMVPGEDQWAQLQKSIPHLTGLPHRMELVHRDQEGVSWYNDSKATNVESVKV